ncbi:MAG: alpha/beta hydrolase-fold protein [Fuerstiella sp.]
MPFFFPVQNRSGHATAQCSESPLQTVRRPSHGNRRPLCQTLLLAAALLTQTNTVSAQQILSPEVHPDRKVTFRLKSESGGPVFISLAGSDLPLQKGENDTWSVTTDPLPPGIHDYSFRVDGTRMIDPLNRNVKKWFSLTSMVEIPGDPPLLTEFQNVPHGEIHRMIYNSDSVGQQRPVMVYTPPGYSETPASSFPLVLLLHGFGDDETAWTEVGRAHLIADNLIASGRIRPCVIAMPYGHPVPPPFGQRPRNYFSDNNTLYERDIMADLLPFLEARLRLQPDAASRSIVGLSMGGGHAIDTGLKNVDRFGAIGAFSAAVPQLETEPLLELYPALKGPQPAANSLKHFWIPIGDRDFLLERNLQFVDILKQQNVTHRFSQTRGSHEWKVWRAYLPEFLELVVPPQ